MPWLTYCCDTPLDKAFEDGVSAYLECKSQSWASETWRIRGGSSEDENTVPEISYWDTTDSGTDDDSETYTLSCPECGSTMFEDRSDPYEAFQENVWWQEPDEEEDEEDEEPEDEVAALNKDIDAIVREVG